MKANIEKAINRIYFNNKNSFNRLGFIYFDGILPTLKGNMKEKDQNIALDKDVFSSRVPFMNLFDINNDLFVLSTEYIDQKTIDCYESIQLESVIERQISSEITYTSKSKLDIIDEELFKLFTLVKKGEII